MKKFTLIIPAWNEASVIVPTLTGLCEGFLLFYDIDWTIIVVDNASTDGTGDAVLGFGHQHVKLLRVADKGKGNAVRMALTKADGDIVGFTDADLSVSPADIISATQPIMSDTADVVIGSRLLCESKTPEREWWRTWSSHLFNFFARHIVGVSASDVQCPLKLMNTKGLSIMLATKELTWFFDLEFLALAERLKIVIKEIPVTWNEHRYPKRKSKLTIADGFRAIAAMLRIRKRLSPQLSLLKQRVLK